MNFKQILHHARRGCPVAHRELRRYANEYLQSPPIRTLKLRKPVLVQGLLFPDTTRKGVRDEVHGVPIGR